MLKLHVAKWDMICFLFPISEFQRHEDEIDTKTKPVLPAPTTNFRFNKKFNVKKLLQ